MLNARRNFRDQSNNLDNRILGNYQISEMEPYIPPEV